MRQHPPGQTRRQFLTQAASTAFGIYGIWRTASAATSAFPQPGSGGVPASVNKITVAVDGWGWDQLNMVEGSGPCFLKDYFAGFLLMRDEQHNIVPGLATEWGVSAEGLKLTLHPRAKWHDGTPITAQDIKWNFDAMRGDLAPKFKGHWNRASRFQPLIEEVQVVDEKHAFIRTKKPVGDIHIWYTGAGYHAVHFGPPHYLEKVGAQGYEKAPTGCGPYVVKEWQPGDRMVLERWDDFWGDSPWYHKPQHKILEIMLAPDAAARYALLKSKQVDVAVNLPYNVAKDLPGSAALGQRGLNPQKGDVWTQTITATGNYNLVFVNLQAIKDSPNKPTPEELKPFDDIRVREAMELALNKPAISEKAHFGLTRPLGGLWFSNSFGYRPDLPVSPYDPARARQLLKEAGYPNGFATTIYYGPFVNSPGIKEWLEAAASFWKEIGIEVKIFEIASSEFYSRFGVGQVQPERKWRPLAVQTWGRQEHMLHIANLGYQANGTYKCCFDEHSSALVEKITSTMDEEVMAKAIAELEDYVLQQRWVIPMAEVSMVIGYTDRVLAHPTPPHAASFEQLWRIVARK
jgi:ABC-type transport system substrate-binding protein